MSNLGTLWFGADIDLTQLKNKINQGNQSILDSLKMNYDPKSYTDMVSDIKSKLAKEQFEIKLTANTNNLFGQGVGNINPKNFSNITQQILDQQKVVNSYTNKVVQLRQELARLANDTSYSGMQRANYIKTRLLPDVISQLSQEKMALNNLKATRDAYNKTISSTDKAHRQASDSAKQLTSDHMRLNATLLGGIHISTQLGSALSSLFAIDAARQFLNNVIEIGGQLEKQRISMGAIIGDTARANELFEQIKEMAVKSPFGVVELDQYSKQLAAYGVEQSKLFDMTKRLADISAGAGQDIGRLALALGHVKSATYLTGITLRQFSMNNIPMIKMLADYYSEVEKRAVSTAEVHKRISERKVSYEDVVEQIKRMTDEGGMFYNMQDKISESVAAKWKNLRDSLDIMYGDLAESKIGDALKSTAEILMTLTKNWKTLGAVLGVAVAYFGTIRIATLAYNSGLSAMVGHATKAAASTTELTVAQRWMNLEMQKGALNFTLFGKKVTYFTKMFASLKMTLYGIGVAAKTVFASLIAAVPQLAIFAGISYLVSLWQRNNQEMENAKSLGDHLFDRTMEGLKNLKTMMEETGMVFRDQYGNISNLFGKVPGELQIPDSKNIDSAQMAQNIETWQEFIKNYSATPNLMLQSAYAIDENGKATKSLAEQYKILGEEAATVAESLPLISKFGEYLSESIQESNGGMFDDDLLDDLKDYENTLKNYKRYAQDLFREHKREAVAAAEAAMANDDFAKAVNEAGIKSDDYASILKKLNIESGKFEEAARKATEVWDKSFNGSLFYDKLFKPTGDFRDAETELENEFGQVIERFKAKLSSENINPEELSKAEALAITQVFTDMATKAGLSVNEVTDKVWELVKTEFPDIQLDINEVEIKAKTSAIKEELNNLVEGDFSIDIKTSTNAFDVIKAIREGYKAAKDLIENAQPILLKMGLSVEGVSTMTDEEIDSLAGGSEFVKTILQGVKKAQKQINDALASSKNFNFSLTDPTKGGKVFRDKKNSTDETLKKWKEQLKELENFYKVYKRNAEYMSKDDAIKKALDSGVFLNPKDLPKNIDDYLKVLHDFRNKVEKEMGKNQSTERKSFLTDLLTKIDEKEFEINTKKVADKFLKTLQDNISKQSEKFNLYKSLLEKTGNKDLAQAAFTDGQIWDEEANKLLDKLKEITGKETFDWSMTNAEAEGYFKGVNGAYDIWKKIVEIVSKNYNEALTKGADAINGMMTTKEKLLKVEKEISDIEDKRSKETNPMIQKSLDAQITAKNKERNELMNNLENESGNILQFYSAILSMTVSEAETAGEAIRKNLVQQLRDGVITGEQYVRSIKKVDSQLEKVRNKKGFFEAFKSGGIEGVKKLELDIADDELTNASNRLKEAEDKLREAVEKNTRAKEGGDQNEIEQTENDVHIAQQELEGAEQDHAVAKQKQKDAQKNHQSAKSFNNTLASVAYAISAMVEAFNDAKQAAAAFGENLDANMNETGQYVMSFLEGANTAISRFQSGDFAGAISGFVFGTISGIAQKHDATLEEDQKRSELIAKTFESTMSVLEKRLESLMGTIDELKITDEDTRKLYDYLNTFDPAMLQRVRNNTASDKEKADLVWGMTFGRTKKSLSELENLTDTQMAVVKAIQSGEYFDMARANMLIQRDELKRQLADEEEKKDKDESKIIEYKEQIAEMEEDIKNFAKDMAETLYDIDFKSWAEQLSETLVNAWAAGENGAEAYRKKVSEILRDLGVKMITERFVMKALTPIMDEFLEQYEKDDGVLTTQGMQILAKMYETGEQLQNQTNTFMDGINEVAKRYGADIKDTSSSSSAGSSIKSITENTADLLASYINAIRADVSVNRIAIAQYYPQFLGIITQVSVLSQTQVSLQQQIAANTLRNADAADRIYDIMHKIDIGATKIKMG